MDIQGDSLSDLQMQQNAKNKHKLSTTLTQMAKKSVKCVKLTCIKKKKKLQSKKSFQHFYIAS